MIPEPSKAKTDEERITRLETELEKVNALIEELENERREALDAIAEAFGVEIFDPGFDLDNEESEQESEEVSLEEVSLNERAKQIVNELSAHSESMAHVLGKQVEGVVVGPEIVHATLTHVVEGHLKQVAREAGQEGEE